VHQAGALVQYAGLEHSALLHQMLAEIVHTRSPQHLYEAQDKAKRRLQKLRSATP
jgi:hypothetical protein